MREGYYSDKYFVRAREILIKDRHRPCVTMQVFGKVHAFLGGIDEAIAILKLSSQTWEELEVWALYDGDEIAPWETVLLIEGPYDAFACWCPPWRGAPGWAPTRGAWWKPRSPSR